MYTVLVSWWNGAPAQQHGTSGQQQSKTMASGKLSKQKKMHSARTVRAPPPPQSSYKVDSSGAPSMLLKVHSSSSAFRSCFPLQGTEHMLYLCPPRLLPPPHDLSQKTLHSRRTIQLRLHLKFCKSLWFCHRGTRKRTRVRSNTLCLYIP